jgi:hypothetical protein
MVQRTYLMSRGTMLESVPCGEPRLGIKRPFDWGITVICTPWGHADKVQLWLQLVK